MAPGSRILHGGDSVGEAVCQPIPVKLPARAVAEIRERREDRQRDEVVWWDQIARSLLPMGVEEEVVVTGSQTSELLTATAKDPYRCPFWPPAGAVEYRRCLNEPPRTPGASLPPTALLLDCHTSTATLSYLLKERERRFVSHIACPYPGELTTTLPFLPGRPRPRTHRLRPGDRPEPRSRQYVAASLHANVTTNEGRHENEKEGKVHFSITPGINHTRAHSRALPLRLHRLSHPRPLSRASSSAFHHTLLRPLRVTSDAYCITRAPSARQH